MINYAYSQGRMGLLHSGCTEFVCHSGQGVIGEELRVKIETILLGMLRLWVPSGT
jgi:hypothetical protein